MAQSSRSSFRSTRRRAMSDINVVPYIDVMLVLLIIFMATAASVNPGIVNLPTVGGAKIQTLPPVFLSVDSNEKITVRRDGESSQTLSLLELGAFARTQAEKSADQPVVLAADKSVKYEVVMDVMAKLKENGVKRVGLAVKSQ
ncbi:MAG: ExbD/TolR family protein [Polynucleobacter sp.]|nr:ExbD/TolR family protein [Polynucleobacter sp.]MDZ4056373.1 ExbD/TolR family protein [Polynucleobacter sp.]